MAEGQISDLRSQISEGRIRVLEVTNCDFKLGWAQTSLPYTFTEHNFEALECPSQPSGNSGEHRDNVIVRQYA